MALKVCIRFGFEGLGLVFVVCGSGLRREGSTKSHGGLLGFQGLQLAYGLVWNMEVGVSSKSIPLESLPGYRISVYPKALL